MDNSKTYQNSSIIQNSLFWWSTNTTTSLISIPKPSRCQEGCCFNRRKRFGLKDIQPYGQIERYLLLCLQRRVIGGHDLILLVSRLVVVVVVVVVVALIDCRLHGYTGACMCTYMCVYLFSSLSVYMCVHFFFMHRMCERTYG